MFPIELLEGQTHESNRSGANICKKIWGEETFNRINDAMIEDIKASLSSDQQEFPARNKTSHYQD